MPRGGTQNTPWAPLCRRSARSPHSVKNNMVLSTGRALGQDRGTIRRHRRQIIGDCLSSFWIVSRRGPGGSGQVTPLRPREPAPAQSGWLPKQAMWKAVAPSSGHTASMSAPHASSRRSTSSRPSCAAPISGVVPEGQRYRVGPNVGPT